MHRIDTAYAQWCLTEAAASRALLPAPGNGPGTQGIPVNAQDARARLDDPADGPLRLVRRGRHADLRGAYRLPLLVTGRHRDLRSQVEPWARGSRHVLSAPRWDLSSGHPSTIFIRSSISGTPSTSRAAATNGNQVRIASRFAPLACEYVSIYAEANSEDTDRSST